MIAVGSHNDSIVLLACIDGCILATLAFILATRHIRLQPEPGYQRNMGAVNNAYITDVHSLAGSGSRKSLNLKPVLLVSSPHIQHSTVADDSISQFSSRNGTNHRFHNPMHHHHHQFQL
jgi:LHFPL tetraspan subfamily member protein